MNKDCERFLYRHRRLVSLPNLAYPARWPKADSTKCFIFEAINIVGRSLHSDDWTGRELLARDWPMSPQAQAATDLTTPARKVLQRAGRVNSEKIRTIDTRFGREPMPVLSIERQQALWDENKSAIDRLRCAVEWLAQRCRDGDLMCYARLVHGGALSKMDRSEWNVDDPFREFVVRGGNLREFSAYSSRIQAYIFLDRQEIERAGASTDPSSGGADVINTSPKQRGRRKGSGSLAEADAPLLTEMRELITNQEVFSPEGAAKVVAPRAKGAGTETSKATRLANRFRSSENN